MLRTILTVEKHVEFRTILYFNGFLSCNLVIRLVSKMMHSFLNCNFKESVAPDLDSADFIAVSKCTRLGKSTSSLLV